MALTVTIEKEVTAESTVAVTAVESMEESLAGRRAAMYKYSFCDPRYTLDRAAYRGLQNFLVDAK